MNPTETNLGIAYVGETVTITFPVTDADGEAVSLAGATGTFRIARRHRGSAVLELTPGSGLTLNGSDAIAEFEVSELTVDDKQLTGDMRYQLIIEKDSIPLVTAIGVIQISDIIDEPEA